MHWHLVLLSIYQLSTLNKIVLILFRILLGILLVYISNNCKNVNVNPKLFHLLDLLSIRHCYRKLN